MDLRADALNSLGHGLQHYAEGLWEDEAHRVPIVQRVLDILEEEPTGFSAPYHEGIEQLDPEWHGEALVTTSTDGTIQLLHKPLRSPPHHKDAEARVLYETYLVGACPRCDSKVPLGPPATRDNLGMLMLVGRPVAHPCPATWEPLEHDFIGHAKSWDL